MYLGENNAINVPTSSITSKFISNFIGTDYVVIRKTLDEHWIVFGRTGANGNNETVQGH